MERRKKIRGKFLSELDVRVVGNRDWMTLAPLQYMSCDGNIHTVPPGIHTDFASLWYIPIISLHLSGKCNKEATLHDYYYKTGLIPRKDADKLFREAIISNEVVWKWRTRKFVANFLYFGVRVFGRFSYKGKKEWNN